MPDTQKDNIRFFATLVGTLCLVVITPLLGWGLHNSIEFQKLTEARLAVLESKSLAGTRYTLEMAQKDFAPLVEKVNDHELRIRVLERN